MTAPEPGSAAEASVRRAPSAASRRDMSVMARAVPLTVPVTFDRPTRGR